MRKILLILTLLFSLAACGTDIVQNDIGMSNDIDSEIDITVPYNTIDLDDIKDYVSKGYIIADVREVDEFESGHIPGAVNAPLSDLQKGELGPLVEDEKYIIVCRSGNRSTTASNILVKKGFDIINVSEGVSSWTGEVEQ